MSKSAEDYIPHDIQTAGHSAGQDVPLWYVGRANGHRQKTPSATLTEAVERAYARHEVPVDYVDDPGLTPPEATHRSPDSEPTQAPESSGPQALGQHSESPAQRSESPDQRQTGETLALDLRERQDSGEAQHDHDQGR